MDEIDVFLPEGLVFSERLLLVLMWRELWAMLAVREIRCHLLNESTSEHILVLFVFKVLSLQVVLVQWLRVMVDWLWVGSEILWCRLIWWELGLALQWSSAELRSWSLNLRQLRLMKILWWRLSRWQLLGLRSLQMLRLLEVRLEVLLWRSLEVLLLLRWRLVRESDLLRLLRALLGRRMCVIIERSLVLIEVRLNSLAHWGSEDWLLLLLLNKRRWVGESGRLIELLVTQNVLPELVLLLMVDRNWLGSLRWALLQLLVVLIVWMEGL